MTKTVITIETFQRTTIHSGRRVKIVKGEQCAEDAPSETAAQLQTTVREALRTTETGEIDYSETESGALLVCRHSCQNRLP